MEAPTGTCVPIIIDVFHVMIRLGIFQIISVFTGGVRPGAFRINSPFDLRSHLHFELTVLRGDLRLVETSEDFLSSHEEQAEHMTMKHSLRS